jgi:hypothetical protein
MKLIEELKQSVKLSIPEVVIILVIVGLMVILLMVS